VASFTLPPFYPHGSFTPVPFVEKVGWVLELLWTPWSGAASLAHYGHPTRNLVAKPTELSWLVWFLDTDGRQDYKPF
jgi:hypothetical protein